MKYIMRIYWSNVLSEYLDIYASLVNDCSASTGMLLTSNQRIFKDRSQVFFIFPHKKYDWKRAMLERFSRNISSALLF